MHELPIAESILEISLRHAGSAQAKHITGLYLVIGQLSSLVDDSLQFYWDIITKDTLAEGAHLHFRRIPAELLCLDCDHRYQPGKDDITCPSCSGYRVKVVAGEEFYLEAIDVES